MTLTLRGRSAQLRLEKATEDGLRTVTETQLS
ncbi:Alkaline phosphatase OS=Streptomyces fumanus OX=67302 GN=GCM10018772_01520 PE=4 SV=1 [Streptomyces fumanus]